LLSVQAVPSAALVVTHWPVAGAHIPTTLHGSVDGWQTTGAPVHEPFWQLSPVVQALLSLQVWPFGAGGFEQVPFAGSQAPTTWH